MKKELKKLADARNIGDDTLKTLNDELNIQSPADLNKFSPLTLHHMNPALNKSDLYELCLSARETETEKTDTVKSLVSDQRGGDEFNLAYIRSNLPVWDNNIDDQGRNGSCTAFATTSLLEYYAATKGGRGTRFSRAFTYIYCNEWEGKNAPWWSPGGIIPYDSPGVWPDTVGRMFTEVGCCLNNELMYNKNHLYYDKQVKLTQDPAHPYIPQKHIQLANSRKPAMQVAMTYPMNPLDWVTTKIDNYLRKGFPSVYAFKTPQNMGTDGSGVIPRRDGDDGNGHSVLIVGKINDYTPPGQERGNWYIFRNSWAGFGTNNPVAEYRNMGCGLIHEHDVYWRTIQALHASW